MCVVCVCVCVCVCVVCVCVCVRVCVCVCVCVRVCGLCSFFISHPLLRHQLLMVGTKKCQQKRYNLGIDSIPTTAEQVCMSVHRCGSQQIANFNDCVYIRTYVCTVPIRDDTTVWILNSLSTHTH